MTKILDRYKLIISDSNRPLKFVKPLEELGEGGQILQQLFFWLGYDAFYFNLKEFINNIIQVKYDIKASFSYYPQSGSWSILVRDDKVYLTTNDDNDKIRINEAYESFAINEFEEYLLDVYSRVKKNISKEDELLELSRFHIDELIVDFGLEDETKVYYLGRKVVLLLDGYFIELSMIQEVEMKCCLYEMKHKKIQVKTEIIRQDSLRNKLLEYFKIIRPKGFWQ